MPTQPQILAALVSLIESVGDTGTVLSRERSVETEAEVYQLLLNLKSQDDIERTKAKGWVLTNTGFTQQRGDGPCEVIIRYRYQAYVMYPYEDQTSDNQDSHAKFRAMVYAVNSAFNNVDNWYLGFERAPDVPDSNVLHHLWQANEDFQIVRFGEAGQVSHVATLQIEVEVVTTE